MNKEKTLYGIIGLLVGLIIGYFGTSYLNRTYRQDSGSGGAGMSSLPPGHPSTDSAAGSAPAPAGTGGGMQGDVTEVINQARNEPSNFEAQMKAGSLYQQINRAEQALEFYQRAYQVKPNDYDLLVNLGNANFDLKKYTEAAGWYEKALQIRAMDPMVRMDLGLTYYLRQPRDPDRAIAEFRKALSIDPAHEKTLQNLTQALIDKGDLAAAKDAMARLEKAAPDNAALAQFRSQLK